MSTMVGPSTEVSEPEPELYEWDKLNLETKIQYVCDRHRKDKMGSTENSPEWRFNRTFAGHVPAHEGVLRFVTHSSENRQRELIRCTPAGHEGYRRDIMGIKQAVQETLNFTAVEAWSGESYKIKIKLPP